MDKKKAKRVITSLLIFISQTTLAIDLVKVDKSERRMYLLKATEVVMEFQVALGKQPKGHKLQRGDQRTPEGRYVLDYVKLDSDFYRAMRISYPNEKDIEHAVQRNVSPGGSIMIHGIKNGETIPAEYIQRFNWTDGCIAITNPEMDIFLDLVKVGTPIEIQW
ncbi:L,D-transpeptidase family protein [Vibrio maerlii]|uniref:L,D-transpeptidase family protein n=1 Tax=Vibrio maerlii TaxID=2231648 RepID=UPI000E3CA966|nr:L,D-transpeptidase family protein [Vibrio maerlii]